MFWAIESLIIGLVRTIEIVMIFFIKTVLIPIDLSSDLFFAYFKGSEDFLSFIKGAGILLATGIFVFQMVKVMFHRTAASKTDSPLGMIVKYVVSVGLIISSTYIGDLTLSVSKIPFSESQIGDFKVTVITEQVENSVDNCNDQIFEYTKDNFIERGLNGERTNDSSTQDSGIGLAAGIITFILIFGLGISYIAFIFKILTRYLFTFVTLYLSPFAYPAIVSVNTVGIFRKYLELTASNLILLFVDLLFLKMMFNALTIGFCAPETGQYDPLVVTALLMGFANIASTVDGKMGDLLSAVMHTKSMGRDMLFRARNLFMSTTGMMGGNGNGEQ